MFIRRKTFPGGVRPPERKETATLPIVKASFPWEVVIPLSQHTGAPASPLVKPGDRVKTGEKIGEKSAFISASVHSSVTGKVIAVEPRPHPLGSWVDSVVIEREEEEEFSYLPALDWHRSAPEVLRERVREAGIVGLGGAAFPTEVKLSAPKPVDTLIINGCECEPCLSADHRLMVEKPAEIVEGSLILAKILGVRSFYFGIEDNKPDAIIKINEALMKSNDAKGLESKVVALKSKYPQGAEKNLIYVLLGREVPSGGLPMDVGSVVSNVGTAVAVKEAVCDGKPLYERVITVSGQVAKPSNLLVRIGTPLAEVVKDCGGLTSDEVAVVLGGPMMGVPLPSLDFPLVKGASGLTVLSREEIRDFEYGPCLKCGRCVDVCPLFLAPYLYALYVDKGMHQRCEPIGVLDCMECGACSYICPSRRPLIQWIKLAKAKILQARKSA